MFNIFKDEKAPYFLALLIGMFGWLFNASIESAKGLRIVEISQVLGKDGDVDTVTFIVANRSMFSSIDTGNLNFDCPEAKSCLKVMPSVNAIAQPVRVGSVSILSIPAYAAQGVAMPALIPAKAATGIRIGVTDPQTKLRFRYSLVPADIKGDRANLQFRIIESGQTATPLTWADSVDQWTLLVIANYPAILLLFLLGLFSLVGVFILFSILATLANWIGSVRGAVSTPSAKPVNIDASDVIRGNEHV